MVFRGSQSSLSKGATQVNDHVGAMISRCWEVRGSTRGSVLLQPAGEEQRFMLLRNRFVCWDLLHPGHLKKKEKTLSASQEPRRSSQDEVWKHLRRSEGLWPLPAACATDAEHPSHGNTRTLSAQQLHRLDTTSPLRPKLAGKFSTRTCWELVHGADAGGQCPVRPRRSTRLLLDVHWASAAAPGQHLSRRSSPGGGVSERVGVRQQHLHLHRCNGGKLNKLFYLLKANWKFLPILAFETHTQKNSWQHCGRFPGHPLFTKLVFSKSLIEKPQNV